LIKIVYNYYLSKRCESYTIKNDVRFVFISSCLQEGPCLIYVFCVCLRIVVSKTYCVFFRLVYPMLPVSLDCSFLMAPSVFSNVYLNINNPIDLFHICHIEGYMFKLFSCLSGTHLSSNVRLSIVSLSRFVKKLEKQIFWLLLVFCLYWDVFNVFSLIHFVLHVVCALMPPLDVRRPFKTYLQVECLDFVCTSH
jgi:hypothetical protein